jgi:peptidase E
MGVVCHYSRVHSDSTTNTASQGRLILLGSGETGPTMVTYHQQTLATSKSPSFLDSSFGFQANADDLSEKIASYFRESVGRDLTPIRLRSVDASALEVATARSLVSQSDYVLAGPGSPTYALSVWRETKFTQDFLRLMERGTLLLASAAALSAGAFTIPVYEIYKVGEKPVWREGLDLFGTVTGIKAAVVPHYNNAEGGRHDTRCCYIGQARLALLEQQLPDDAVILGIDEHTGIELDIATQQIKVFGRGGLTVRSTSGESHYESGSTLSVDALRSVGTKREVQAAVEKPVQSAADLLSAGLVSDAIAAAVEDLDIDRLHAFIIQLASHVSSVPQDDVVAPFIEAMIASRKRAREAKNWAESDVVRDFLISQGIEINDGPDGTTWRFISDEK